MRGESPHSVDSPKLTPSPPSNVPPNIHQVNNKIIFHQSIKPIFSFK